MPTLIQDPATMGEMERTSYEAVEHHHIMSHRKHDHGYSQEEKGTFEQSGETSESMGNPFNKTLRKMGHPSSSKHYSA